MGVTIETWRSRIGTFHRAKVKAKQRKIMSSLELAHVLLLCITALPLFSLLLICAGDVELNPGPPVLKCRSCSFESSKLQSFYNHQMQHSIGKRVQLKCPISESCVQTFSTLSAFKTHIDRHLRTATGDQDHTSKPTEENKTQLVCQMKLCNKTFRSIDEFKAHLRKEHLQKGQPVPCIFKSCATVIKSTSYFATHLSRDHREREVKNLNPEIFQVSTAPDEEDHMDIDCNENITISMDIDQEECILNQEEEAEECFNDDQFIKTIANFYLKLEVQYNTPKSRIQEICKDFGTLLSMAHVKQERKLQELLAETSITEEEKKDIVTKLFDADILHHVHQPDTDTGHPKLHSTHLREKYIRENFVFIEPELIDMRGVNTSGRNVSAYIVPLRRTLDALLSVPKFQEEIEASFTKPDPPPNVLTDFTDGDRYKRSATFKQDAIRLFFYQDAFEVVVPIGSAKLKHKIIGFYFMIANLPPKYRTKLDMIQLVMLVKEADWKILEVRQKCWDVLTGQITELINNGIPFKDRTLLVTLECFMGDNLGQNHIGGYVESFRASYYCRYCNLSADEFKQDPTQLKALRTPEEYDSTVARITYEEHIEGIKFAAELNIVPGFHVSATGLPPCIHHDLSEGVITYDMILIIKALIKDGWFTLKELNEMITKFKCQDPDSGDKPAQIPQTLKSLGGNAVQNWNFLRFFPVIINGHLKNADHPAWRLYLDLRHLCDLVCAPEITREQVFYLKVVTEGYLYDRTKLFPAVPLRPKHHFLMHYCQLILELGPLVRYSTLRCESKHCPFKRIARSCGNYINLCYTLAMRHQWKFAHVITDVFPPEIAYDKSEILQPSSYIPEIEAVINKMKFSPHALELKMVTISSIQYKPKQYLVIGEAELCTFSSSMYVGDIYAIFFDQCQVFFLVKRHLAKFHEDTGFYCIHEDPYDAYLCLPLKSFHDHLPLAAYKLNCPGKYISLKYFLSFM